MTLGVSILPESFFIVEIFTINIHSIIFLIPLLVVIVLLFINLKFGNFYVLIVTHIVLFVRILIIIILIANGY